MFTPQQIDHICFDRVAFGGYDMQSVDEFLEPLTEDYVTLYKENALLKSKMKVLVAKLEEYRTNEDSMKDAIVNAQKTCDMMVKDAEAKCTQMLQQANEAASESTKNADAIIAAEEARVEEARQIAYKRIDELKEQIASCVKALDRIQKSNMPTQKPVVAYDYDRAEKVSDPEDSKLTEREENVADEISASLQALVGKADESAPMAEPYHPASTTTSKFANLQFGPNYTGGTSQR